MSTEINITVDRDGLLKRNRQQTTANRQTSLERQLSKQSILVAEEQRQKIEKEETTGSTKRQSTKKDDIAAYRREKYPFILLWNSNKLKDDIFSLSLTRELDAFELNFNGFADFSADNEASAYLWVPAALTPAHFFNSKTGIEIKNTLFPELSLSNTTGVYRLISNNQNFLPTYGEPFKLKLTNLLNNGNGNFGLLAHGFVTTGKSVEWHYAEYKCYSGTDFELNIAWGASSQYPNKVYFGPLDAPVVDGSAKYFFLGTPNSGGYTNVASTNALLNGSYYLEAVDYAFEYGEYGMAVFEPSAGPNGANALRFEAGGGFNGGTAGIAANMVAINTDVQTQPYAVYGNNRTFECFVKCSGSPVGFTIGTESVFIDVVSDSVGNSSLYFDYGATAGSFALPLSVADFATWTHLAITLTNNQVKLFIDGQIIGQYQPADPQFQLPNKSLTVRELAMQTYAESIVGQLWISSARVVDSALYTAEFTPPTSIT